MVDQILVIGRERAPLEACGVVTPDMQVITLDNTSDEDPTNSYSVDNEDLVDAIADYIDRCGIDPALVNRSHFLIWHTHPSGLVGPSLGDMKHRIAGFLYGVVTLPDGPGAMF